MKRVRTVFKPEQLERLEQEFLKQQYMVGTERVDLAATLHLTETQVRDGGAELLGLILGLLCADGPTGKRGGRRTRCKVTRGTPCCQVKRVAWSLDGFWMRFLNP